MFRDPINGYEYTFPTVDNTFYYQQLLRDPDVPLGIL